MRLTFGVVERVKTRRLDVVDERRHLQVGSQLLGACPLQRTNALDTLKYEPRKPAAAANAISRRRTAGLFLA